MWLRNGVIRKIGGSGVLIPLTDELLEFEKVIAVTEINKNGGIVEIDLDSTMEESYRKKIRGRTWTSDVILPRTEVYVYGFDNDNTFIVESTPMKDLY